MHSKIWTTHYHFVYAPMPDGYGKKNIPISESGKYLFLYSCFNAKRETEDIFCRQRAIDEFADEVKVATR